MIYVLSMRDVLPEGAKEVNTTSHATDQFQQLSPFKLGPCDLYDGFTSVNMENAWQYAKVYASHINPDKTPNDEYWNWAKQGWSKKWADRYPMGKGVKPMFSWWKGSALSYIEARKAIYVPLYAKCIARTDAYAELEALHQSGQDIALRDFDGYMYHQNGYNLTDVLNNPSKNMGHAFVIAMLLSNDDALKECDF